MNFSKLWSLFLFPVGITLGFVGNLDLVLLSDPSERGALAENLERKRPLDAVVGGTVSFSSSSSSSFSFKTLILTLFRTLFLPPVSEGSNLGLTLFLPLKAVPVLSPSVAETGFLLMMPETDTGSTEGAVTKSGLRENVGGTLTVCELGKVACSTFNLGGKMALFELS